MKTTQATALPSCVRAFKVTALAAATTIAFTTPAAAFQFEKGEWTGSLDTTLSYGLGVRVEDRNEDIIGFANGGNAASVNGDDGNLNFDNGDVFSNAIKVSTDLLLNRDNYGAFFRVNALYDDVIAQDRFDDRPLNNVDPSRRQANPEAEVGVKDSSDDAVDLAGERIELFDAYVFGDFYAGDRAGGWKVGNQVLSWGESTFIQNSINAVNPFDVSKLRIPGSELKEALIPVPLVSGSIEVSENSSLEAFYQLKWEPFRIDPTGAYFSTNDFAGEGGFDHGVMLSFGGAHESGTDDLPLKVSRADDEDADDEGQFGFAYRLYAPELNDTEFGFYFMNYHSRLPLISGTTATTQAVAEASVAADAAFNNTGGNLTATVGAYINQLVSSSSGPAQYNLEYPEDIQLYGVSFNTNLGRTGVALQGELSHRVDVPLQVDDVALLIGAIAAANGDCVSAGAGSTAVCQNVLPPLAQSFLGEFGSDEKIPGFIKRDVTQLQSTATKVFSNVAGADRLIVLGEVGFNYVHDLPEKDELPMEVNGTYKSSDPVAAGILHSSLDPQDSDDYADDFSWGYVLAGRLEYLNAIGPVNFLPKFSYKHDVKGNSPGPGGSFLEDRKAVTLGADFDYQNKWTGGLSYTSFFGAGDLNLLEDRDFVALNVKYSF